MANSHPFSPSVNILRDAAQPLAYSPTPNARLVFRQLAGNYRRCCWIDATCDIDPSKLVDL